MRADNGRVVWRRRLHEQRIGRCGRGSPAARHGRRAR